MVNIIMETVELGGFSETKNDSIRLNFGGGGFDEAASLDTGIDLLMNHRGAAPKKVDFTSSSMDDLERELNSMVDGSTAETSGDNNNNGNTKLFGGISDWFSSSPKPSAGPTTSTSDSKIGQATKESIGNAQTWDGFMKINDTHVANSGASASSSSKPLSELEKRRKKRAMIRKLDEWRDKGLLKNASHYNMDSNYEEVEDEYETALEDKRKSESLKLQAWWLKTLVTTVEFGSSYIDFDLSGFGEQVEDDIHSYDEIFEELYEKYKGGKMHPVVSLLLKLGLTAATVNITNRALSTATPGFRDVIKQSPELMKMFTSATVDAMSQKSPGFSFANQMMDPPKAQAPSQAFYPPMGGSFGPPMEPVSQRSVRPDLQEARGNNNNGNNGMSLRESDDLPQQQQQQQQQQQPKTNRPQMRGPSADIEQLFSGLKPSNNSNNNYPSNKSDTDSLAPIPGGDDSIVSIASLKELQNTQLPKSSSKRRNRSEKNLNIVSLDI